MLKYMGSKGEQVLLQISNKAWKKERLTKNWEMEVILPIFKEHDQQDCNNYRVITHGK